MIDIAIECNKCQAEMHTGSAVFKVKRGIVGTESEIFIPDEGEEYELFLCEACVESITKQSKEG